MYPYYFVYRSEQRLATETELLIREPACGVLRMERQKGLELMWGAKSCLVKRESEKHVIGCFFRRGGVCTRKLVPYYTCRWQIVRRLD